MYKIPEDIGSKYEFVTLASKRAEQLQMGAAPRAGNPGRKATVIAQEEVATGVVAVWRPEEETVVDELVEEE